jgi:hypothetical protein
LCNLSHTIKEKEEEKEASKPFVVHHYRSLSHTNKKEQASEQI